MSSLADRIIEANEEEATRDDLAPEGYYTDDMGYWVEQDIKANKARFAEYIFVRCRRLNPHLYWDPVELVLFNRHEVIEPTIADIIKLANTPDMITPAQAIWVYNKLRDTVPRLDRDRVLVAPGLAWNIKGGMLEEIKEKYYTVGGSNEQ